MPTKLITFIGPINSFGNIITIDAMGTQTDIAEKIIKNDADYILAVKENQKQLLEEIKDDKLPIILINGKKVSELLLTYMNRYSKTLTEIVEEQDEWAKNNLGTLHYETILNN